MVSNMFGHASTSRWLMLCIFGIATAFLVNFLYSRKVTADIEQDISLSLGPGALYVAGQTNGAFRPNLGGFDAFLLKLTR